MVKPQHVVSCQPFPVSASGSPPSDRPSCSSLLLCRAFRSLSSRTQAEQHARPPAGRWAATLQKTPSKAAVAQSAAALPLGGPAGPWLLARLCRARLDSTVVAEPAAPCVTPCVPALPRSSALPGTRAAWRALRHSVPLPSGQQRFRCRCRQPLAPGPGSGKTTASGSLQVD